MRGLGFLQTMGNREKRLIGAVLAVAFMAAVGGVFVYLNDEISVVEEELEDGRDSLVEIRALSQGYLDSMRRKAALEAAIKENDPRIQTAIDAIARKIEATQVGEATSKGNFSSVLRYEAKTNERPVYFGATGKKKGKRSDFVELSQPVEYSFVKFIDLVKFLEQIESPERMMYVSKLQITKKYMEPEFVQGRLTVSTFIYRPQNEEEED